MPVYRVTLKNTKQSQKIEAKSELEAKVKYCQKKGLIYRAYASKLEVKRADKV